MQLNFQIALHNAEFKSIFKMPIIFVYFSRLGATFQEVIQYHTLRKFEGIIPLRRPGHGYEFTIKMDLLKNGGFRLWIVFFWLRT